MYANADTEAMAADVLEGLSKLFSEALSRGLIDRAPPIDLAP
jgi:hypothetical protein